MCYLLDCLSGVCLRGRLDLVIRAGCLEDRPGFALEDFLGLADCLGLALEECFVFGLVDLAAFALDGCF